MEGNGYGKREGGRYRKDGKCKKRNEKGEIAIGRTCKYILWAEGDLGAGSDDALNPEKLTLDDRGNRSEFPSARDVGAEGE
ncbi:hypothetical protein Pmani_002621 [Petrolisthes manimaculis]|uniref:Uncharacterized protein n=1 Tax=Petrolisthes manimaculis TaxID=1843537 RepID=A0AAE1QIC8_9EUCA|nr:hypothetical protein Pmani_002621 [Petrolisthes manimaculis]